MTFRYSSDSSRSLFRTASDMMCQRALIARTFSTSRTHREVIQAHGQTGSNQKSIGVAFLSFAVSETTSGRVPNSVEASVVVKTTGSSRGSKAVGHRSGAVSCLSNDLRLSRSAVAPVRLPAGTSLSAMATAVRLDAGDEQTVHEAPKGRRSVLLALAAAVGVVGLVVLLYAATIHPTRAIRTVQASFSKVRR